MREIEIKAKLKEKKVVMEKLAALGCEFENPITQSDVVYAERVGSLETFLSNNTFLRIRVKGNGKILFTLKKDTDKSLAKIEHETEISSKEEMEQALLLMGYKEAARVEKTRITTHYDDAEICIDDVTGLGAFIEMERLVNEGDAGTIQTDMWKFFETLGILAEDRVTVGYDILMLQKAENEEEKLK